MTHTQEIRVFQTLPEQISWEHQSVSFQAQSPLEVAPSSIQPGVMIQYRIPTRIQSPANYKWEWHSGTIELVDVDWQMVLIIPETEKEPWRWVAMCYISKVAQ